MSYAVENFTKWTKEGKSELKQMVEKYCPDFMPLVLEESSDDSIGTSDDENDIAYYFSEGDSNSSSSGEEISFGGKEQE